MNNCGTCKYWSATDDQPKQPQPSVRDFAKCLRIVDGVAANDSGVLNGEPAYTIGGPGRLSALKTKADFGCVLWEGVE